MDQNSKYQALNFIQHEFQQYYEQQSLSLPDRFGRREFAFVFFGGKGMMRHLSFPRKQDFNHFIQEKIPMHAYYSSAYYQHPDAPTMQEKEWMGAELIFDLDSDHLPNADTMSYEKSLSMVKIEFEKLVNEFLLDDFGFQKKYLELYFSGGRGYHCHVKDPAVMDLDSSERREIVDYITARDLRDTIIFREHATGKKQYGSQVYASGKSLTMPSPQEPGWKGRISREIITIVEDIVNSEDPLQRLQEYGVDLKDAERLASDLSGDRIKRIKQGMLDQSKTIRKFFLNRALRKSAVSLSAGETDEPVTCDIKRLIRLPFSLHGKTGFQVTPIPHDKLNHFDPLEETVLLSDTHVLVQMHHRFSISLKNEEYNLEKEKTKIPIYLAVFLLGRGLASLV